MKYVPLYFLFPLVPSLGSLDEHASSCGHAKMVAWPCIKLKMKTCINWILHNLLQMAKHVLLQPRIPLHPFPKWPKQEAFHAWPYSHAFGKKKEMFKCAPYWIHSLSRAILLRLSPPHLPLSITHQTFPWISIKCTMLPHSHFGLELPNLPLNEFPAWPSLYLTPYTLYKTLVLSFHTLIPLKREKSDISIKACKHSFPSFEAFLSSFLLLHSYHLKIIDYYWWSFLKLWASTIGNGPSPLGKLFLSSSPSFWI